MAAGRRQSLKRPIEWFQRLIEGCRLESSAADSLAADGFAVIDGPAPPEPLKALSSAYDRAVAEATASERSVGATTTRLHDLVNRGAEFDGLYLHPPLLAAARQVVGHPFKLSNMLARTVHPRAQAQRCHTDVAPGQDGWPMLGFILMLDPFTAENGATRFLRGSHKDSRAIESAREQELVPATGDRGCMVIFHGSVIHGHGRNVTDRARRSIQGAYIPRHARGFGLADRMTHDTRIRIGELAEYLIAV
jgi:hypothetical protein